jgi:hypothetical protein
MFTPAVICKLWNRVSDHFGLAEEDKGKGKEKAKKPSPKVNLAMAEDTRIEKGLEKLRTIARGDLSNAATAEKFSEKRDKTVKSMKKYCKLLKSSDLREAVKDLGKLRTAVKKLTVVVEALTASPYPPEEKGEPKLGLLDKVDTSALDKAMEDPRFGEFSAEELADLDSDEAEGEADVAPREQKEGGPGSIPPLKQQEPVSPAAAFKAKYEALSSRYLQALKSGASNGAAAQAMQLASKAGKGLDYQQGLAHLDALEAELSKASAPATGNAQQPQPQPEADLAAQYKRLKAELFPAAFTRAADARPAQKDNLIRLLSQAVKAEKANRFEEGLARLTQLSDLIKEALAAGAVSAPANPNAGLLEAARKTAEEWKRTRQAAKAGVETLQKTLIKTKDGRAIRIATTLEARFKTPTMGVDTALAQLTTALAAGTPASGAAAGLTAAVNACAAVLADELVAHIESNPFSVQIDLKKPLSASLQQVRELIKT